jgi:hypothetical protein
MLFIPITPPPEKTGEKKGYRTETKELGAVLHKK